MPPLSPEVMAAADAPEHYAFSTISDTQTTVYKGA
jgi:hypothetical protein